MHAKKGTKKQYKKYHKPDEFKEKNNTKTKAKKKKLIQLIVSD